MRSKPTYADLEQRIKALEAKYSRSRHDLKEREAKLSEVQKIARLGRWELDLVSKELQWSDFIYDIFEVDRKRFGGSYEAFLEAIHPDDRDRVHQAYRESLRNKMPYEITHRLLMKDGRIKWVSESCRTDYDSSGQAVRSVGIVQDITERMQATDAAWVATQNLQSFLNNAQGFFVYQAVPDDKGPYGARVLFTSPSITDVSGMTDPYTFSAWIDNVHPDDAQRIVEANRHSIETHETFNEVMRWYHRQRGEWIWLHTISTPVYDRSGRLIHFNGLCIDITDRKQREEALRHELDLLQTIMNGAGKSQLVYLDRAFNFVRVNESYAASCGYLPEEMIGKNHFTLYPNPHIETVFARVRDTGEDFMINDNPFVFPDQPERGVTYWDWTLKAVKDTSGLVIGLVFSLYETTERKRAEDALEKSEEQFRTLVNNMQDIVFRADLNGDITFTSPSAAQILGCSSVEEMTGMNIGNDFFYHPDEAQRHMRTLQEHGKLTRQEMTLKRRDNGEPVIVSANVQFFRDKQGTILGIEGVYRDITERKQVERDRERLIAELQEALNNVKTLSGLLPICAHCKKIRDDRGYWNQIESYIKDHSKAEFSHGICPDCMKQLYPDVYEKIRKDDKP